MNEFSTKKQCAKTLDLLTKSLSLACDMPPADIDTSEHLQLREFLLTTCAVVVVLKLGSIHVCIATRVSTPCTRVANWIMERKKEKENQTQKLRLDYDDLRIAYRSSNVHTEKVPVKEDTYEIVIYFGTGLTVYSVVSCWHYYIPNLEGKRH